MLLVLHYLSLGKKYMEAMLLFLYNKVCVELSDYLKFYNCSFKIKLFYKTLAFIQANDSE